MRSSFRKTLDVWEGLFIRESYRRILGTRNGLFWVFFEPLMFIVLLVAIRSYMNVTGSVYGLEMEVWLAVGLGLFMMFRDSAFKSFGAISANYALFHYKQLKPIDTVYIRVFVEVLIRSVVLAIILAGLSFIGYQAVPAEPFLFGWAFLLATLLSFGFAVLFSVWSALMPEVEKILKVIGLPFMFVSGALIPIQMLPQDVQSVLMVNPIVHVVEMARMGISSDYVPVPGVSSVYVLFCGLIALAVGLSLHIKHEYKVKFG